MNYELLIMRVIAGYFLMIGYFIGNVIGYGSGIDAAARIWEKSLHDVTAAFIVSIRKHSDAKDSAEE